MPLAALLLPLLLAQGQLSDLTKPQEGRSMRVSSTFRAGKDGKYDSKAFPKGDLEEKSNWDNFRVQPGQTHVLMDVQGSGVITHMWMTFLAPGPQNWAPNGSANHRDMLLRVYWDGSKKPAIEAPVGDFFANCFGRRDEVLSLPVVVEDADSYNCFWNMPFRKSARIEIVNQSDKPVNLLYYNIDWIQKPVPRDAPYFYAQYRQEYPVRKGKDYVVLETRGKGHYVGTVLAVRTRSPQWFGEGDEKIFIDGEENQSIHGTGTEDYFLSAWGLKKVLTPYFGVPYFDQWGIVGGHTSAYRWHVNDPIVFQKGIRVAFEHFGWMSTDENPDHKENSWNEREDDYASVAFWYQTGEPTFTERAPAERRLPNLDRVIARDGETHGNGNVQRQRLDLYDNPQILYMPPTEVVEGFWMNKGRGFPKLSTRMAQPTRAIQPKTWKEQTPAWIEIPFEVTKREPLRLLLNMTTSYDFGTYEVFITGPFDPLSKQTPEPIKLGVPLDFYSADIKNREFHLLDFWPEPGKYFLGLACTGKNRLSSGYFLGIESVRLRERRPRVTQFGWDKDKDWRKNPTLY